MKAKRTQSIDSIAKQIEQLVAKTNSAYIEFDEAFTLLTYLDSELIDTDDIEDSVDIATMFNEWYGCSFDKDDDIDDDELTDFNDKLEQLFKTTYELY